MRAAGRGRIILISSQGGVRGMPSIAAYSAAKGALERWGESMAGEVAPFGIGVTILVTGTYDTDIITDAGTTDCRDFDGPYARTTATIDRRGRLAMKLARPPEIFAAGLAGAWRTRAFGRRPIGPDARMLLIANRILPSAGVHHMSGSAMRVGSQPQTRDAPRVRAAARCPSGCPRRRRHGFSARPLRARAAASATESPAAEEERAHG